MDEIEIPELKLKYIIRDILQGLLYCHENLNLIVANISPETILIEKFN